MTAESEAPRSHALALGILIWSAIMVVYWPAALSFQDDVGYVGEAKLLLLGRVLPHARDVGVWVSPAVGVFPKYPLFPSLLMTPFVAVTPRAAFGLALLAAIALAAVAGRILRAWGQEPAWALLILAHPTIVILTRTASADLPLSLFAVAAWWALRRERTGLAIVLIVSLIATKATGFLLAGALGSGEVYRDRRALLARERGAWRRVATLAVASTLGLLLVFVLNEISAHRLGFAYDYGFSGTAPFSAAYLRTHGPIQARNLLLIPPLLAAGVIPFWRRREWGPVLLIVVLTALMSCYFFADFGTNWIETVVLAPRLVLPVVAFLMVGYADVLATWMKRLSLPRPALIAGLIGAATMVPMIVISRHARWQAPMRDALNAAEAAAQSVGTKELGVTFEASKVGVLFRGPTRLVTHADADTAVVLCSTRSASYRQPMGGRYSCDFDGYRTYGSFGDYAVLVRQSATVTR